MKKTKTLFVLLLIFCLALVASSCGDDEEGTDEDGTSASSTNDTTNNSGSTPTSDTYDGCCMVVAADGTSKEFGKSYNNLSKASWDFAKGQCPNVGGWLENDCEGQYPTDKYTAVCKYTEGSGIPVSKYYYEATYPTSDLATAKTTCLELPNAKWLVADEAVAGMAGAGTKDGCCMIINTDMTGQPKDTGKSYTNISQAEYDIVKGQCGSSVGAWADNDCEGQYKDVEYAALCKYKDYAGLVSTNYYYSESYNTAAALANKKENCVGVSGIWLTVEK